MTPKDLANELFQTPYGIIQIDALNTFRTFIARKFHIEAQFLTSKHTSDTRGQSIPKMEYFTYFNPSLRFKFILPINNTTSTNNLFLSLCFFWHIYSIIDFCVKNFVSERSKINPKISESDAVAFAIEFCKIFNSHISNLEWVHKHYHLPENYNFKDLISSLS